MAKEKLNRHHVGLTLGIFAALWHAVWALAVAADVGQNILDWIFPLHFLNNLYSVIPFSLNKAIMLIIMALVVFYVTGWLFAAVWNYVIKKF